MKYIEFKDEISINQQVNINIWEPENDIACVICFVHGFGEHSARYSFWAENFCKRNIAFAAIDLIGFGKSSGKRGAIKSYADYLFCVRRLISVTKNRFPEKPIILYGHSLGGNIACSYALKNQGEINGLVLSSPWLKLAISTSWLNILFQTIWKSIFQIFSRRFYIVNYYLSHNPKTNIDFNTSPLNHRKIRIKMFFKVVFAGIQALKRSQSIQIPCYLQHGKSDRITSIKASKRFAQSNPSISFVQWDNAYHELHNEANNQEIFEKLYSWINEKVLNH